MATGEASIRPRSMVGLVTLVAATTACADGGSAPGAGVVARDSAGVAIAHSRLPNDPPACRVVGESLRIGAVDESAGTPLFGVNGAAVLGDGRIAVVNRGSSRVMVFTPDGDLVSAFGRQGEGPEEFENLWSVHVRGADTLVVGDYRPWRFSFFTPEGELLRRIELVPAVIERPDFAIPLGAGSGFVMEEPRFEVRDEMVDRIVPLRIYGEDGENVGSVGDFWMDRFGLVSREMRYVGTPIFGARASFSHLRDDLVVYGPARHEQLEIWSVTGGLRRIVRWDGRPREVGSADADLWRRQRRQELESYGLDLESSPVVEAQIGEHLPVAERYPAYGRVIVSDRGGLWVEEYRRPFDQGPARWLAFDPDGGFRCVTALPTDLRVLAVTGTRVLGLVRDDLDVEYVVGIDVEDPPAGPDVTPFPSSTAR